MDNNLLSKGGQGVWIFLESEDNSHNIYILLEKIVKIYMCSIYLCEKTCKHRILLKANCNHLLCFPLQQGEKCDSHWDQLRDSH